MSWFNSVTINISPFVKHSDIIMQDVFGNEQGVPKQFTKMDSDHQQKFLQRVLYRIQSLLLKKHKNAQHVEDQVYEPTKRGDHHLHALFCGEPLTKQMNESILELSFYTYWY